MFASTPPFPPNVVLQLLQTRTLPKFPQQSITPELEVWIGFVLKHVRLGYEKKHLQWLKAKYFSTPESETLVCDLIRFICCCIHPTNAILSSDIIPRYVVIGFLLRLVKANHMASNAKLALLYDWFFYTSKDNIMNIEPGILLMVHSIPKYPIMTVSLVEFLVSITDSYYPEQKELLRQGIRTSLKTLLSKGVVPNIQSVLQCQLLTPSIIEGIRNTFGPYASGLPKIPNTTSTNNNGTNTNGNNQKKEINNSTDSSDTEKTEDLKSKSSDEPKILQSPESVHKEKHNLTQELTSIPSSLRPLWKAFTKNPSKIYLKELLDSLQDFVNFF